ncbi:hypothetical protein RPMD05_10 [Rhodobacteraceae phage LS06-2018-MD05]|nr:hypothetical protein RPMD05_10 [Rhodobacteraceae phage LS06-2018-MD05]
MDKEFEKAVKGMQDLLKNKPVIDYLGTGRSIIIYKNKPYSTLITFCNMHGLKYNTWIKKQFPIEYLGDFIYKEKLIK